MNAPLPIIELVLILVLIFALFHTAKGIYRATKVKNTKGIVYGSIILVICLVILGYILLF